MSDKTKRYSFRTNNPIINRYLDAQPNTSAAICEALLAYIQGQASVSLASIYDRLGAIERTLKDGVPSKNPSTESSPKGDGLDYLDTMGL